MSDAETGVTAGRTGIWLARAYAFWASNRAPILVFLIGRAGLFLVAYISLTLVAMNPDPAVGGPRNQWRPFPNNLFVDGWARWDSGWYNQIAVKGYQYEPGQRAVQQNVAFFPLYPLAMRLVGRATGNTLLAGMLVSNAAFLTGLVLLYHHTRRRFDEPVAFRTLVLLSVYPFAFYFSAVYSEALFFMFVVAAFVLADHEWWWAAGLCGLFAGLTRFAGVVMLPVLGLLYLEKAGFSLRRIKPSILWVSLAGAGPVIYFAYLYVKFGKPWIYLAAQRVPGWWLGPRGGDVLRETVSKFWNSRAILSGAYDQSYMFNLALGLLFALTLVPILRRQGPSAAAFVAAMLVFSATQWINLGRYMMPAFPAFIAWALWFRTERRFLGLVIVSTLLLALWTIAFTHWYWVT